jgi:hypothetical protein
MDRWGFEPQPQWRYLPHKFPFFIWNLTNIRKVNIYLTNQLWMGIASHVSGEISLKTTIFKEFTYSNGKPLY